VLGFPLLIVPFAIYNMIAFIVPMDWGTKLYTFRLMSGVEWSPTLGDAFFVFSLLMLMFEFIKATSHGKSLVEHFLSIVLAGSAAAEFVMVKEAGTSVFVLFVAICFVDMFAGFAASLRRARRRAAMAEMAAPAAYVGPVPMRPVPAPAAPTARVEPVKVEPAMPVASTPVVKVDPVQKIEP
jgi:hypothetical protein